MLDTENSILHLQNGSLLVDNTRNSELLSIDSNSLPLSEEDHGQMKTAGGCPKCKNQKYFIQIKFLLLVTALRMKSKRHVQVWKVLLSKNFNKYKPFLLGLMFLDK